MFKKMLLLLCCSLSANLCFAALYITGDFTGQDPSGTPTQLSGNWSLYFDDAVVTGGDINLPGSNYESFVVPLATLSLYPNPLGSTVFDTANTRAELFYLDGIFTGVKVRTPSTAPWNDGFELSYSASSGELGFMLWSVASDLSVATSTILWLSQGDSLQGSMSITAVPVPAAMWLFGSALISLGVGKRYRR